MSAQHGELVPLYGFVRGDTLGLLVLVRSEDTIQELGDSLMQAAAVRVAPMARAVVYFKGNPLAPNRTVAEVGLRALERVDLLPETTP